MAAISRSSQGGPCDLDRSGSIDRSSSIERTRRSPQSIDRGDRGDRSRRSHPIVSIDPVDPIRSIDRVDRVDRVRSIVSNASDRSNASIASRDEWATGGLASRCARHCATCARRPSTVHPLRGGKRRVGSVIVDRARVRRLTTPS